MAAQFWNYPSRPGTTYDGHATARYVESSGWDGMLLGENQNLWPDPFVYLGAAAMATDSVKLGIAVTNPITRHPAVLAAQIATLHVASNGRAELGIGRGDSAAAYIGKGPAKVADFENYLAELQTYLRGEDVDCDGTPSRIEWLADTALPKVVVGVAAGGPRTIAAAARQADRVTFALGANPERIAWGIETARSACVEAGLDPDDLSLGAYINGYIHDDVDAARDMVRGGAATFIRFSGGKAFDASFSSDRTSTDSSRQQAGDSQNPASQVIDTYDRKHHGSKDAGHAHQVDDKFLDDFAVYGPAERCIEKLTDLMELGIDYFAILTASREDTFEGRKSQSVRFGNEVISTLRNI
jgi:5,10-methylenetetrahydromethanopterin reductase